MYNRLKLLLLCILYKIKDTVINYKLILLYTVHADKLAYYIIHYNIIYTGQEQILV